MAEQNNDPDYPRMLYRWPGDVRIDGRDFATRVVEYEEERDIAMSDGWHLTTADALAAGSAGDGNDDAPPTRAELMARAKELGLEVKRGTTDAALLAAINKAGAAA